MKKNFCIKITSLIIVLLCLTIPFLFLNQNIFQNRFQSLNLPRTNKDIPMESKQQGELIIFDGMFYNWQWDLIFIGPVTYSMTESYSYLGGNIFTVTENNPLFGGNNTRDVNNLTRLITSSGIMDFFIAGAHEPFCIFNNASIGNSILIATANIFGGDTERMFQVTGEKYISKLGSSLDCWELTDSQDSVAYYEKTTGLLLSAHIMGTYDYTMNVTNTNVVFPSNDYTPQLTDGKVIPTEGDSSTIFNFTVNFTDADNNRPDYVRVTINNTAYEMSPLNPGDKNYIDGAIYNLTTPLQPGNCTFYFNASDGMYPIGFPASGRLIGPNVTYKNDYPPILSNGEVIPNIDYDCVPFTFKINYTDLDNNEPLFINVTIDGIGTFPMSKQIPSDLNFMDGCIYTYTTILDIGNYTYYFNASDGVNATNFPAIGYLIGPNVTASPLGIFDGMFIKWTGKYEDTFFGIFDWNGTEIYSYLSGISFQVDESVNWFGGMQAITTRDIDIETRIISNAGTLYFWTDDDHEIFCIPKTTTMYDIIPIATPWMGSDEYNFNVTGEKLIDILGRYQNCWELTGPYGSIAYYEKYSGVLINATFYDASNYISTLIITDTNAVFKPNDYAPQLMDGKVEPIEGNSTTIFNFTVNYSDADDNRPIYIRVTINNTAYEMSPLDLGDKNYVDGVIYNLTTPLPPGNCTFYFNTSDSLYQVGFPDTGRMIGPNVTYINDNTPQLSSGSVTPTNSYSNIPFLFQVTYTDADNNPPIYINITLNNTETFAMEQQNPYDLNYIDGCIFEFETYLTPGSYSFHFNTSDDGLIEIGYPISDFIGPNVSYPQFEIFDGMYYSWEGNYMGMDWNGTEEFSYQSGVTFHVDESLNLSGTPSSNQRDLNMATRLITNSIGPLLTWSDGTHDPFFIFNTTTINDQVNISVLFVGDVNFTVIGEKYIKISGTSFDCWELIDGQGSTAYYEKKTGILINGTFEGGIFPYNITITASNAHFPPNDFAPQLLDGKVDPLTGNSTTIFNFTVNYTDVDNNRPEYIRITLNETSYDIQPLDPTDTNYIDGVIYNLTTPLQAGNYTFYFNASDGLYEVGYPQVGKLIGPNITYINDNTPILSNGEVIPIVGYEIIPFTFKVNYTDFDNNEPLYINVSIEGVGTFSMSKQDPMDLNFMDGCLYISSVYLNEGNYTFYFNTSDDEIIDVGFPAINALIGPNVTISPLGIFDGLFIEWAGMTIFMGMPFAWSGREDYSYISGNTFHVEESVNWIIPTNATRDIDIETRIISNAGTEPFYFWGNSYHEPFSIPKSIKLSDTIPIATPWGTEEYIFTVTGEKLINILGLTLTCWELTGPQNSLIYYEKYSGLLIDATFYDASSFSYTLVITNTNAVFETNVTEEKPSGPPSLILLLPFLLKEELAMSIIIIIIGAVAATIGILLFIKYRKKPIQKRVIKVKHPKMISKEEPKLIKDDIEAHIIEKEPKESELKESIKELEFLVKEKKPITNDSSIEREIKEIEAISDEEIQYIQNLEKEQLIEHISNIKMDMLDTLPLNHPIIIEVTKWRADIIDYALANLTRDDAKRLIIAMKKWEKEIFQSN
ncbi:MAG: hypothetical protein HWN67_13045 [Candidatus Helarchaeota archaeon]|nr:hypothetical protein [Candidatus Helarchaeota archaeon]